MGGTTKDRGLVAHNLSLYLAPEYKHWDMMTVTNMGLTAEKLLAKSGLSKLNMDQWAVRSHQLAAKAQAEGFFKDEILSVEAPQADGRLMVVDKDQAVRGETTLEDLAKLKPAFNKDGQITAGVSSPLNAAGTGLMLMSKEQAKAKGISPWPPSAPSASWAWTPPSWTTARCPPASRSSICWA